MFPTTRSLQDNNQPSPWELLTNWNRIHHGNPSSKHPTPKPSSSAPFWGFPRERLSCPHHLEFGTCCGRGHTWGTRRASLCTAEFGRPRLLKTQRWFGNGEEQLQTCFLERRRVFFLVHLRSSRMESSILFTIMWFLAGWGWLWWANEQKGSNFPYITFGWNVGFCCHWHQLPSSFHYLMDLGALHALHSKKKRGKISEQILILEEGVHSFF